MRKLYTSGSAPIKALFAFFGFLLLAPSLLAQTTAQIGAGTLSPTSTLYAPAYRFSASSTSDYSRSNILFTAVEMSAAGIATGSVISKIAFYKVGTGATTGGADFKILMANSVKTAPLATTTTWTAIQSTHTLVYSNAAQTIPPATGWVEFALATPFTYTGNSLEIAFDWNISAVTGNPSTNYFDWQYTAGFSEYIIGNVGSTAPATLSGTTSTYKHRPNTQFTFTGGTSCTGTPSAGTASSSKGIVCAGETFTLSTTGATSDAGITYQWQSSVDGVNWSSISGATASTYTSTQASSTFYRVVVTCTGSSSSANSNTVNVYTSALASGSYAINNTVPTNVATRTFNTFNEAYNYIKCGINGPVVFNVATGSNPYNEQLIMNEVPGTSAVNTIRFNGNGQTISFNSTNSNQRAVIKLDGADHVTFDNLVIAAPGTTTSEYGWGVQLMNNADSNTISRCTINLNTTSSSSNYAGIVFSASETSATTNGNTLTDGNRIVDNTITGGYYGITLVGGTASSTFIDGNHVTGNTFQDFYYNGIYVDGTVNTLIEGNNLKRPVRTSGSSTVYGIYITGPSHSAVISKNRIHSMFDSYVTTADNFYGIYFSSADAVAGKENKVTNNLIYDINSNGQIYGIYNSGSDYAHFLHNTISLDDANSASSEETRGFYQLTTATGIVLHNNIISITRGGTGAKHVIYMGTTTTSYTSTHNNFYITPDVMNNIGRNGTVNAATLDDWKTVSGKDSASVSIDPAYQNRPGEKYAPTASALDNKGTPVGINTDIVNAARSATTPDMGAYEFSVGTCATPPSPGSVSLSTTGSLCPNTPVSFNLTGNSIGIGQTYQWERAASLAGPWTAISNVQTSPPFDHTVGTETLYYRAAVTCSGTTAYTPPVQIVVNPLFPGGTYTINSAVATGGTNFQSFNDAYSAMRCGISGAVVFNVAPGSGPYTEQLIMTEIGGTSATNTITFNGSGATIAFTSINGNERAVIKLNGTDYITFNNLVVHATGTTTSEYGYGFQLMNDADFNTINNCEIRITTTSTSTNYAGIVVNNSPSSATATGEAKSDDNTFSNNTITGGYYGITLVGNSSVANQRNKISNNRIQEFNTYGIYVNGSFFTTVEKNLITRPTRTDLSTFYGIYFTGLSTRAHIKRNVITNPFGGNGASTSTFNGIYFTGVDALATLENIVSNNVIYGLTGSGDVNGIYNSSSDNVWYYHNTLSLDGTSTTKGSTTTTRGFYQTTSAGGIEFKNNIISITEAGNATKTAIYLNTPASALVSDHNNFYLSSLNGVTNTGYANGNEYSILAGWQTATGQDANSLSNNPVFEDLAAGNLKPTNAVTDNLGTPVGVLEDFTGAARSTTTPDIGAYEFAPPACVTPPLAGTALVSESPVCENSLVQLSATGYSTGLGQTYQWQAATDINGSYANISGILSNPSFTTTASSTFYYRLAVTCSGSTQYSVPVLLTVNPGLPGGVYTIDATQPASATNFVSFNAAKDAMACGITGPITFNVEPNSGPYQEQLVLDSIRGASAANTIVFNGNGNTLAFSSATSAERAVIKLSGADHITFDSLVIDATGSGTYGWGVQLINNADSNTFRNNTILTNTTSTSSSNYGGIVINASATSMTSGSSMSDANTFDKNRITGGYYGITVMGSTSAPISNNRFTNNVVEEFYNYGFYISNTENTRIEGNLIQRPIRQSPSTFYGIYFTGQSTNALVSKNILTNPFGGATTSTSATYGIYFSSTDATAAQPNKVVNNLLYDFNGAGIIYALYNSGSDHAHYYHNTVSLDNTTTSSTSATRGFYQTSVAEGIEFKNNLITISRGGTGAKHGIYMGTTGTTYNSNHNNIYVSATNAFVGRNGTADLASLTTWQAAAGQDANSVSEDPQYTNLATGNLVPLQGVMDNKGTPVGVPTDLVNAARSTVTPDIGAYEFAVLPCTAPPTAGAAVASPSAGICLGTRISLQLNGNSSGGFQKYVWQMAATPGGPWTNISDTLYAPEFEYELSSASTYFRASVTCGASTVFATPVQIAINPALVAGDYTIDPAMASGGFNFQSFNAAVQALACGIAGPVRFHVVPGTYTEQVRISKVPGSSAINTVTFQSQNGNASSVVLTYDAPGTANYVLKLDSANHITFKNLSITAVNTESGRAVEIAGTASNDSLVNNLITVPVSTSTSNSTAGIYGSAFTGNGIVIKGNTLANGSSNIYLTGTTNVSGGFVIEDNTLTGAYYYGIYTGNIKFISVNNNTVNRSGVLNTSAYGIYISNCDSAYKVRNNRVHISNTGTTVYGIYLTGNQTDSSQRGFVVSNKITADNTNTGNQYGLYVTSSTNHYSLNNVISINTSGTMSYGIYSTGTGGVSYYNNTVQSAATSASTNVAAYFSQTSGANGNLNIRNNIFSHIGGGRAMYVVNPRFINSDYNLFYTTGATLIQWSSANLYPTLQAWRDTAYWDYHSIVYKPAFANHMDLIPDVASPDVWALHGRGEQIAASNRDFTNMARPVTLTSGVPDLGAYEFMPTSVPVTLTATPATPAPGTTQTFMLGTDTVAKIKWGATVPSAIEGKRYSGVVPPGLAAGMKHMYFYTDFAISGSTPADYKIEQFYLDPWQGFIENERTIKLGRTNASNVWVIAAGSTVDHLSNTITEGSLNYIGKFTGLTDGNMAVLPPIVINPADSANRGKNFWVGYGHHQDFGSGNAQEMVLYLGAAGTPAKVTVRVNGTSWMKTYTIPSNTVIASDFLPKYGAFDSRLVQEGVGKGISIESDVPITAYAHIYGNTNSGATMLMPVGTYGFEYYALTAKQNYAANTYSWFYVVAPYDSTVVEITPSKPTTGGRAAGVPFRVQLKKGEVYQVMGAIISGNDGYDMTGSIVKSVANANGKCYPVAMFSGSSRTNIGCGGATPSSSGDNIIQQNFPYRAWGRKYLTAPTSSSTNAATPHNNIYKVAVKDPSTIVKRNGTVLTNLIDNLYYQFESNTADFIEANKPVMVAQFIPSQGGNSTCGNSGVLDPEMIYISPIEQGIRSVALYRNTKYSITTQYLTLCIPTAGVSSLMIDGSNTFDYSYAHPNLSGYTVVVKRWDATDGQTFVKSDSAFTAITYGLGSAESYGYNAGTLIKNLNVFPSIVNVYNTTTAVNDYTCAGTPFKASFLSTVQPQKIEWNFAQVANLAPNANVVQTNPTPESSMVVNGVTYYKYSISQPFVFSTSGTYHVPIFITHPDVEGCDNRMEMTLPITVLESPVVNFNTALNYCQGSTVQFNGISTSANGTPVRTWSWDFDDNGATSANQNATHLFNATRTFNVKLSIVGADGCIANTTKPVQVTTGPAVNFAPDSIGACLGGNAVFTVQNPVANAVYKWYTAATGGTLVHTGNTYTINNLTGPVSYFVASELNGCVSASRKVVKVTVLPALATPVVQADSVGANSIRFKWNTIAGAVGYEVSTNGGSTWTIPSSGQTGTTHTISNLQVGQTVILSVRASGGCSPVVSLPVTATTVTDQVFIPNTFSPNGDGLNDVLQVYGNTIRSIRFMVFNQWGEKLVESTTPARAWDGTYKGKMQPSGVYVYVCTIILTDGTTIQRKGSVNVIR